MTEKSFRVASQVFFLTYPRCDLDKEDVFNALQSEHEITWCKIAQEEHKEPVDESGIKTHLHVIVKYSARRNVKRQDFFDMDGFHPNIIALRPGLRLRNTIAYLDKEDKNCFSFGDVPSSEVKKTRNEICKEALATGSVEGAMQVLKEQEPWEYMKHRKQWQSNLAEEFRQDVSVPAHVTPSHYMPFRIPEEVLRWKRAQEEYPMERTTCLVILGESQLAKTKMILSLFPEALYMHKHIIAKDLKNYRDGPKQVIIDDVNWDRLDPEDMKGWCCQRGEKTGFSGKWFEETILVTWSTIVIANHLPAMFRDKYWDKNIVIVDVKERLY